MSSSLPASIAAGSRALYRSLLRTAIKMPDDHRRALVVFRARSEFDKSSSLTALEEIRERQTDGEIYKDQLEFQAQHLQSLAQSSNLLIPVDIRAPPTVTRELSPSPRMSSSSARRASHTRPLRPSQPSRPVPSIGTSSPSHARVPSPPLSLSTSDRRKLIRAVQSRREGTVRGRSGRNRFMEGPEPSWIVKRRERQQQGEEQEDLHERETLPAVGGEKGRENKHDYQREEGANCGCGSVH